MKTITPETSTIVAVLMPFAAEFTAVYQKAIRPAIEVGGFRSLRADDQVAPGKIMEGVLKMIQCSSVVIADLTGRNANVLYELGLAHALQRPVILLTQSAASLPFDVRHLRVIEYSPQPRMYSLLRGGIARALKEVRHGDSPGAFLAFDHTEPHLGRAATTLTAYELARDTHELAIELGIQLEVAANPDAYIRSLCARIDSRLALLQLELNAPNWLHRAEVRERVAVGMAFSETVQSMLKSHDKSLHAAYELGKFVCQMRGVGSLGANMELLKTLFTVRLPTAAYHAELPETFIEGVLRKIEQCLKQSTPAKLQESLSAYGEKCKRRSKSAAGVTWVTGQFKSAASSLTMKHVSQYGRLERDTETGIGRGSEPAADTSGDEDALADVEEDPGTQ